MRLFFVMAACLVCLPPNLAHSQGRTVIITAWREHWIHKDQYSGSGELNPLRVSASPGDIIEFRQSEGQHGMFFYGANLNNDSELGRRVSADHLFEVVVSDHKKMHPPHPAIGGGEHEAGEHASPETGVSTQPASTLSQLDTRIFPQQGRQTGLMQGRTVIIRIRMTSQFNQPLYFGDLAHHGDTGFGVISPEKRSVIDSVQPELRKPISLSGKETPAWTLNTLCLETQGITYEYSPEKRTWVNFLNTRPDSRTVVDIFANAKENVASWNPQTVAWKFALCEDFDGDRVKDLFLMKQEGAAITSTVLKTNAQPYRRLRAVVTGENPYVDEPPPELTFNEVGQNLDYRGTPVKPPFAAPIDLNRDGLIDLVVLETQNNQSVLQPYLNKGNLRFQPEGKTLPLSDVNQPTFWAVTDSDYDGWFDLLIGNPNQNNGKPVVLLNAGENKGFREILTLAEQPDDQVKSIRLMNSPASPLQGLQFEYVPGNKESQQFR